MQWFNLWGLILMIGIMVPNIVFAVKCKDGFENRYQNRVIEVLEQIGRYGSFGFMIINIPGACLGWWTENTLWLYVIVNGILVLTYCVIWIVCFKQSTMFRALALSILPSVVFLFSGVASRSLLLIVSALIFAPCHILISCKNAKKRLISSKAESAFFRSVIEQDECAVVICDLEHIIVYMNRAAIQRYQKRGGEALLGKSVLECHNEQSCIAINKVVEWFKASKDNNRVLTYYNEKENKDVYMVALRNAEDNLIGYYEKHEYRNKDNTPLYQMERRKLSCY